MNKVLEFVQRVYTFMVRLYPRPFRDEFGEEMQAVFKQAVHEAAQAGPAALLIFYLRELFSLPFNILREFRSGGGRMAPDLPVVFSAPEPKETYGSPREVILAGLPHLVFSLFVGRTALHQDVNAAAPVNILLGVLVAACFIAAAMYAWREGWPRWSASWFGYWIWLQFTIFAATLHWFNARYALFVEWQFVASALGLMLIFMVVGVFWLFRADRIMGLLAVFFLMPVGLPMTLMEFVPDHIEGMLALGSGVVTALSTACIVWRGEWRTGVGLALGGNLIMGVAYSYVQVFIVETPFPVNQAANPLDFFLNLTLFFIGSAALIGGPLFFWRLWDSRKRRRAAW